MFNNLVVCVLLCILRSLEYAKGQSDSHQCVEIQHCPELYDLLQDPTQRNRATLLVRQANCGYNGNIPKVWCTNICKTPDGLSGTCKPLANCASVSVLFSNQTLAKYTNTNYLRGLRCALPGERYAVCCPSNEDEFNKRLYGVDTSNSLPDPDNKDCGWFVKAKITNGEDAELGEYPWIAILLYEESSSNTDIVCSGTLISSKYVITAAHCVDRSATRARGELNRVSLGEHDTKTEIDCVSKNACADLPLIAEVESVTIHPGWYTPKPGVINNDIALVRLVKPVKSTKYIYPICLKANLPKPVTQELAIAGWGKTHLEEFSTVKQKAKVRVANRQSCEQKYKIGKGFTVGDGEFCAEGKEGRDTCTGDSGGPIMLLRNNAANIKVWFLAGIVSFGHNDPCGDGGYPGLYTDISKYWDWIKETIQP